MPDWPSTTRWLSQEEQILAAQRLAYDGVSLPTTFDTLS